MIPEGVIIYDGKLKRILYNNKEIMNVLRGESEQSDQDNIETKLEKFFLKDEINNGESMSEELMKK